MAIKVICPPPEGNIVWSCYLLVASSIGYKCGIVRLSLHVPQLVQCPELLTCSEFDDMSVRVFRPSGNLFGVCSVLCWQSHHDLGDGARNDCRWIDVPITYHLPLLVGRSW